MVGGLQPLTMIDFPGKLSAVIFLKGCNLRCRYCHNPSLVEQGLGEIAWPEVTSFLTKRRGFLEGVVFSGGEPTFQDSLREAIREVREMGFAIGLHTNGSFPGIIRDLVNEGLLSFIAVDVKAPIGQYSSITGAPIDQSVQETARLVAGSGLPHEFRTTIHPFLVSGEWLESIGDFLKDLGISRFVLQKFQEGTTLDPDLPSLVGEWLPKPILTRLRKQFARLGVRGDPGKEKDLVA